MLLLQGSNILHKIHNIHPTLRLLQSGCQSVGKKIIEKGKEGYARMDLYIECFVCG